MKKHIQSFLMAASVLCGSVFAVLAVFALFPASGHPAHLAALPLLMGMAGPITTGSFARSLWPGVNQWFNDYKDFNKEWVNLFDLDTSTKAYEKDVGVVGTGLASVKAEGAPITYDSSQAGFEATYTPNVYATGLIITEEAHDDNLYPGLVKRVGKGLRFSLEQTKEIICANVYNNAFTAGITGADGVCLASNAHPYKVIGGTWSNIPSVTSDVSEAAFEQAVIDVANFTDERGLRHAFICESLHLNTAQLFNALRVLKSVGQNNTANNAINALREAGIFSKGVFVNHYFTSPVSWFIRTNVKDGLRYFQRRDQRVLVDNDTDTRNAKYYADERYVAGWTDPRAIYASVG